MSDKTSDKERWIKTLKFNTNNKFLTKLFSITLSGVMLLGSVAAIAAEDASNLLTTSQTAPVSTENSAEDKAYADAVEILTQLNVIEPGSDFEATAEVGRETMAVLAAKLIGVEKNSSDKRYFVDVPETSYGAGAIEYLTGLGIFSQPEDKRFNPENIVSGDELTKVVTSLMGYDKFARANGGYPAGYRLAAKRAELNTTTKEKVTYQDLIFCFESALEAEMYEPVYFGGDGKVSMSKTGENILSIYHKIYTLDGGIEAIGGISLDNANINDDEIVIGGNVYKVDTDMYKPDMLGRYVKFYYKDYDNQKTVKLIQPYNNEKIVEIEDVDSMTQSSITYYTGEKKTTESLTGCVYVYNGSKLDSKIDETLKKMNKGTVMLCDTDDNDKYDAVIIWDYANFVVAGVGSSEKIISNKLAVGGNYKYDDYEEVLVYDLQKNEIDWSDIKTQQILAVAASNDKKVLFIITSDAGFNGTVESVSNNGDDKIVTVNGVKYEVEKTYKSELESLKLAPGSVYSFKTDSYGRIAYADNFTTEGSMTFGYIMDSAKNDNVFDDFTLQFKLMSQDGKISVVKLAENTRIDGAVCKGGVQQALAFGKTDNQIKALVGKLIRYNKNADGDINVIDTATVGNNETEESSMTTIGDEKFASTWYNLKRLGLKAYVDPNKTMVFCVPATPVTADIEKEYKVGKASEYLVEEDPKDLIIYTTSTRNEYVEAVIYKYDYEDISGNYGMYTPLVIVDNVTEVLDSDGSVVKCIEGMKNGSNVSINIPDEVDISNVGSGDIIKLHYGINGQVIPSFNSEADVVVYYDYSASGNGKKPNWSNVVEDGKGGAYLLASAGQSVFESYRADTQLSFGYVAKKTSKSLWWDGVTPGVATEMCNVDGLPVVIYDSSRRDGNKLYKGSIDDIEDFTSAGNECSRVILHTGGPYKRALYVFK